MDIGIVLGIVGIVLTVVFGVPAIRKKKEPTLQITTENYETIVEKLVPLIKETLNDKSLSENDKQEKINTMTMTSTRINEICEFAAELYENGIRDKLKNPNLSSAKLGKDLIITVHMHDKQVQGVADMGIPRDENGNTISLQAWLAIFTNYPPEWWIEIFQEIAFEATVKFQIWGENNIEPELKDFCRIDERGRVYKYVDVISHKGGYRYDEINPVTKEKIECPARGWLYHQTEMHHRIADGHAQYVGNTIEGRAFLKDYLTEIM